MKQLLAVSWIFFVFISVFKTVFTGGDGSHNLVFTGSSLARMRTANIEFSTSGSILYDCYGSRPADTPTDLFSGTIGSYFRVMETQSRQTILTIQDFNEIVIIYQGTYHYNSAESHPGIWAHHSLIWAPKDSDPSKVVGEFRKYTQDVDQYQLYQFEVDIFSSFFGFVDIGRGTDLGDDVQLNGRIDNFCYWKRKLSVDEIGEVRAKGCGSIDSTDKILQYEFEKEQTTAPQIWNSATEKFDGVSRMSSLPIDGDEEVNLSIWDSQYPMCASGIPSPIINTGLESHNIHRTEATPISLSLDPLTEVSWKLLGIERSALDVGIFLLADDNSLININEVQTKQNIVFVPSSEITATTAIKFNYMTIDGSGNDLNEVEVSLIPANSPICNDIDLTMDEGDATILYLSHDLYLSSDGQYLTAQLLSKPSKVEVRLVPETVTTASWDSYVDFTIDVDTPFVNLPMWRFAAKQMNDLTSDLTEEMTYQLTDGLNTSEVCKINILVKSVYKPPSPTNATISLAEDEVIAVTLNYSDKDDDPAIITISEFPSKGQLIQFDSGLAVEAVETFQSIDQWAIDASASSYWPTDDLGPDTIIGPANVYPAFGEYDGAWQPSMDGEWTTQWVTITLKTPVRVNSVKLFETWHGGAVTSIYVKNLSDEWELAWTGEWRLNVVNPDVTVMNSHISMYELCPKPFLATELKFDIQLTEDHWYALDAVLVYGQTSVPSTAVTDPLRRLLYKPFVDKTGVDSFKFQASDCQTFLNSYDLNIESGAVGIDIMSVNDPPVATDSEFIISDEIEYINLELEASDVDDGDELLYYHITKLPLHGILKHKSISVSIDYPVSTSLQYFPSPCEKGGISIEDTIAFSVRDNEGVYDVGFVSINIDCQDKPFEYSNTLIVLFLITNISLLCQVMFLIISFKKHRRNIVVRLAGYRFSIVGLLFSLSASAYASVHLLDTSFGCRSRNVLLFFCIGGYYGVLFLKSLRISRFVNNKQFKVIHFSDRTLFIYCFIPLVSAAVIIGGFISGFGMKCEENVPSISENGYLILECSIETWALIMEACIITVLFVALAYISWKVKNAPVELNDANYIVMIIFLLGLFFLFKLPLSLTNVDSPNVKLIIEGIAFPFLFVICNLILFSSKMISIHQISTTSHSATTERRTHQVTQSDTASWSKSRRHETRTRSFTRTRTFTGQVTNTQLSEHQKSTLYGQNVNDEEILRVRSVLRRVSYLEKPESESISSVEIDSCESTPSCTPYATAGAATPSKVTLSAFVPFDQAIDNANSIVTELVPDSVSHQQSKKKTLHGSFKHKSLNYGTELNSFSSTRSNSSKIDSLVHCSGNNNKPKRLSTSRGTIIDERSQSSNKSITSMTVSMEQSPFQMPNQITTPISSSSSSTVISNQSKRRRSASSSLLLIGCPSPHTPTPIASSSNFNRHNSANYPSSKYFSNSNAIPNINTNNNNDMSSESNGNSIVGRIKIRKHFSTSSLSSGVE
eukprot:TRINITY_DN4652_c0_g1_i1.p1 TRINITY_DN4652_c0_g1~~TRINITY_DN4652_c0_g1_i1.p1  ORF type:complete len:1486 (+),score=310.17 TRINITY_DN4652_c0_g1_i1:2-4459(+)